MRMTKVPITVARRKLFDLFDDVVRKGARIVIDRLGKDKVAMISIEDLEKLQALEDAADVAAADAALAESDERIPYDEVRKELGL